ncbi:MAG: UDP-N-acetylglucosamine 2-epimerase (hydrolyzing) [Alphaproteobacteria bacterium]|nr:UDP-N-acetylglucosamine 2-epimerase (hydrolyzing) [Alphaproteobacteria bacterium]
MQKKRKVCVVVASRANYGRIRSVLSAVQAREDLELQLIVGASALLYRFGNVVELIEADGFKVTARIYSIVEGENLTTMAKSAGLGITELATHFENLEPDIVLTVADRFETISTAIAASYMNIPVAHTQGGEVTGSIDESVRHAITKLSHIHLTTTALSSQRVVQMGEHPDAVYRVGCPALDVIKDIDLSLPRDFFRRAGGVGKHVDPTKPYLVVLQHPVTTEFGSGLEQINETLEAVHDLDMQAVWLWPNVDAGSDDISKGLRLFINNTQDSKVSFFRNFAVEDYARIISNCACLVGNSSSAIREGAFLGVPAVNIGTRQAGRERAANIIDVPYEASAIRSAITAQISHGKYDSDHLYGDGLSGRRVAEILATCPLGVQKTFYSGPIPEFAELQ